MSRSLDIVIVNWNTGGQLRACLASIAAAAQDGFVLNRVVVVDNGSKDGSAEGLQDFSVPLMVLRNRENRGFAAACNQGAQGSAADYLLFLNPDVRLYPDSLARPIRFMEEPVNARIGICGIQLVDESGRVDRSCARFPTPRMFVGKMLGLTRWLPRVFPTHAMTEWDHGENRGVDQVIGAFFLIRRSLFQGLNGFDERFFVYFEEVDLSFRAARAGWSSFYLADARAVHRGGGSSEQVKAMQLFYSLRSRIQYGFKHFHRPSAVGVALATLLLEPLPRLGVAAARRSPSSALETLHGYALLWGSIPRRLVPRSDGSR
ncbi:MAG: glycosyltransferase family 2 protein [Chloroflexota bacterium]|nr:glycosyltransferase family 2 protein [Chloroflexota bacterium]